MAQLERNKSDGNGDRKEAADEWQEEYGDRRQVAEVLRLKGGSRIFSIEDWQHLYGDRGEAQK